MPKKVKARSPTPEVFQVEVITAARVNEDGGWEYCVKWANYPDSDNSWEPHENVQECTRLLKSFWDHIGVDDNDYPIGWRQDATQKWINKEKALFAKQFAEQEREEKKKKKKKLKEEEKASKKEKKSAKSSINATQSSKSKGKEKEVLKTPELSKSSESPDSDADMPLANKINLSKSSSQNQPYSKKRKSLILSDDDSDDADLQHPRKLSKSEPSLPGPSMTSSQASLTIKDAPSSPSSLFSATSSPAQVKVVKVPPPKSSWKSQPKVKLLDIEPRIVSSGSALDTKQRILQKSGGTSSVPAPPPRRSSLANLAFKKVPMASQSSGSGLSAESTSKPAKEPLFGDLSDFFDLPTPYQHAQDENPLSNPHHPPDMPPGEASFYRSPSPLASHEPSNLIDSAAIEEFLNTIQPPPDRPMMDISEPAPDIINDEPIVPRSMILPRPPPILLSKIPKKWKWTGDLFIDTGDHAERVCSVILSDATDPTQTTGLRLSFIFSSLDSIRFDKLLNVPDLDCILPASGPVQQLARISAESSKDDTSINNLATVMEKMQQVAITHLSLDNAEVAYLIVFPTTMRHLWRRFTVPNSLQRNGALVAALFPLTMTPAECSHADIHNGLASFKPPSFINKSSLAIAALEFPDDLRLYMSQPNRTYCVWWTPGDGSQAISGPETQLLHDIMRSCKAKDVGHKADVRVVFVHVGALTTLHRLPALAERRSKRPEIHFYTYGYHASVPREQWGVRAIYPLGGIVTFTPHALLNHPVGAARLMRRIVQHPFWDCYILPSVMGMAAKASAKGKDPLSQFEAGEFLFQDIIAMIEEGEVSLLQSPPVHGDDPGQKWLNVQLKSLSLAAPNLIKDCLSAFSRQYSKLPETQLTTAINTEISQDMLRMQTQPSIMKSYRRFVIITASNADLVESLKDGFEWKAVNKLDFRDNYFDTTAS